MKINRFYAAYVSGVMSAVFLMMVYSGMKEVNSKFSDRLLYLKVMYTKALKLEKQLEELSTEIRKKDIKVISKKEAENIILKEADTLIKLYDAQVAETLKEENGCLTITLSFKYYPETSEDLLKFLLGFKNKVSPVIVVKNFELNNTDRGTEALILLKLIQPFFKEKK